MLALVVFYFVSALLFSQLRYTFYGNSFLGASLLCAFTTSQPIQNNFQNLELLGGGLPVGLTTSKSNKSTDRKIRLLDARSSSSAASSQSQSYSFGDSFGSSSSAQSMSQSFHDNEGSMSQSSSSSFSSSSGGSEDSNSAAMSSSHSMAFSSGGQSQSTSFSSSQSNSLDLSQTNEKSKGSSFNAGHGKGSNNSSRGITNNSSNKYLRRNSSSNIQLLTARLLQSLKENIKYSLTHYQRPLHPQFASFGFDKTPLSSIFFNNHYVKALAKSNSKNRNDKKIIHN